MLKWAVTGPRQTYMPNADNNNVEFPISSNSSAQRHRKRLKRKSSDLNALRSKASWLDKENQFTSTPLPRGIADIRFIDSSASKMDSLKDLSNIVTELGNNSSPLRRSANKISRVCESTQTAKEFPDNYASTLPTFDVEYSPCALIPGPMLALRGVGIPDSYFEKPRYITSHPKEGLKDHNEPQSPEMKRLQRPSKSILHMEESTLSSTKMGDATLDRMINAILESNHKERKLPKSQKNPEPHKSNMSPTYTPADDPASDLHEVWDSEKARYRQKEQKFRAKLTKKNLFNELKMCSPISQENLNAGQLRRQRGLRRKQKIKQIKASVVNSAQKFLGKATQAQNFSAQSDKRNNVFTADHIHDEMLQCKLPRNISPDSGHNTSSDYEEDEAVLNLKCTTEDNKTLDTTKRRLSFSLQNL